MKALTRLSRVRAFCVEVEVYYKVLRRSGRDLYSALVSSPGVRVEYTQGTPCRGPHGTPLFAFSSLERAKEMARLQEHITPHRYEVWQCDGEPTDISVGEVLLFPHDQQVVRSFWAGKHAGHWTCPEMPDTVLLESITLVRRIL